MRRFTPMMLRPPARRSAGTSRRSAPSQSRPAAGQSTTRGSPGISRKGAPESRHWKKDQSVSTRWNAEVDYAGWKYLDRWSWIRSPAVLDSGFSTSWHYHREQRPHSEPSPPSLDRDQAIRGQSQRASCCGVLRAEDPEREEGRHFPGEYL